MFLPVCKTFQSIDVIQVQVEADEKNMTETGQIIADEKNMTEIVQLIDESEPDR